MSIKVTINNMKRKIWQAFAHMIAFILYCNLAYGLGPVINDPYNINGQNYSESDLTSDFSLFQNIQQQLGCLMVPHTAGYIRTQQISYTTARQYCVDSNKSSSFFNPQINLRELQCIAAACHYDVTTFSNLYGQCLEHAGKRYCLRIATWNNNGNSDGLTNHSASSPDSDNLLIFNPSDNNPKQYGLYKNDNGSYTLQSTNLLPLYPQLVNALNPNNQSSTPTYLPSASNNSPVYWGDQLNFTLPQNVTPDDITAYATLGPYVRACIYQDPLDGTDTDYDVMGFHYLTPNPNGGSYSNAQTTAVIGAASMLLVGLTSPIGLVVALFMALADAIESTLNQVVVHERTSLTSGSGPIGCIDVPSAPGPPPFCNPMEIVYATPLIQRVCEATEATQVSPSNACVTTSAICNLPNVNQGQVSASCASGTTNSKNALMNSQNTPLVRVTYDNIIPNCQNLPLSTKTPCVNFNNLSFGNINSLPSGLLLTNENILHVYYNDLLPVCANSGGGNPCVAFSSGTEIIPQPGNGGYRIVYAVNSPNSQPPYNPTFELAGASGVPITSLNSSYQGSFVDWVNVDKNAKLEIIGVRNADYFDLSCQFDSNNVCQPNETKQLMDPSSIKDLSNPHYVSYFLTTNPINHQQLCVYQLTAGTSLPQSLSSDSLKSLIFASSVFQVGCVPNPSPEPPIVAACTNQPVTLCSPSNPSDCITQNCPSTHTNPAMIVAWGSPLQSTVVYTNAMNGNGNQKTSVSALGTTYTTMVYDDSGRNWANGTSVNQVIVSSNYDNVGTDNTRKANFPSATPVIPAASSGIATNYSGGNPTLSTSVSVNDDYNNTLAYTTMNPGNTPIGFVDSNGKKNLSGYLTGIEFASNGQYIRGATTMCLEGFSSPYTTLIKSTSSTPTSYDPADALPLTGVNSIGANYQNYTPYSSHSPKICYANRELPTVPSSNTAGGCNSCNNGSCTPGQFDQATSLQANTIDNSTVLFNEVTRPQTGFEMNKQYQICVAVPQPTCAAGTDSNGNQWPEATAGQLITITCSHDGTSKLYRKCYANGDTGVWGAVFNPGTFTYGGQQYTTSACKPVITGCAAANNAQGLLEGNTGNLVAVDANYNWPATALGQQATGQCAAGYVSCAGAGFNTYALCVQKTDNNGNNFIGFETYESHQDLCVSTSLNWIATQIFCTQNNVGKVFIPTSATTK